MMKMFQISEKKRGIPYAISCMLLLAGISMFMLASFTFAQETIDMTELRIDEERSTLLDPQGVALAVTFHKQVTIGADLVAAAGASFADGCSVACSDDPNPEDCLRRCAACTQGVTTDQADQLICVEVKNFIADQVMNTVERVTSAFRLKVRFQPEPAHVIGLETFDQDQTPIVGQRLQQGYQDWQPGDAGSPGGLLSGPVGMALDSGRGALYVTDHRNCAVRRIDLNNCPLTELGERCAITTIVGGDCTSSPFASPEGIALTKDGLVVVDNRNTVSLMTDVDSGNPGVVALASGFDGIKWITSIKDDVDPQGTFFYLSGPGGLFEFFYDAELGMQITRLRPAGDNLEMMAFDGSSNLYVLNRDRNQVLRTAPCALHTGGIRVGGGEIVDPPEPLPFEMFASTFPDDEPIVRAPATFSAPIGAAIFQGGVTNGAELRCAPFSAHLDTFMIVVTRTALWIIFEPQQLGVGL